MGIILPYFPIYLSQNDLSAAQIGFLTGLLALAKMVAPPWVGHLLDATSPRFIYHFTIIASALAAVSASLIGVSTHFYWLAAAILLFGIFWAIVLPLTDGLSISMAESKQADYGHLRLWGSIGFITTSLAGGLWLVGSHIHLFPLILTLLMLLLVYAARGFPIVQSAPVNHKQRSSFPPQFYLLLLIACLMQMSHGAYYGFFSLYLSATGFSGIEIAGYWVIGVAAEVFLMWRWTQPLQHISPRYVVSICMILAALRWFGTGFTTHATALVLLQLLHAASFAAFHVTTITWVKRIAPRNRHAAAQGLFSAAGFGLGSTIGIMISGIVSEQLNFQAAFYLCGVIALIATPLAWWLPKRPSHHE